jgi:hypothetical protein
MWRPLADRAVDAVDALAAVAAQAPQPLAAATIGHRIVARAAPDFEAMLGKHGPD